MSRRPRSKVELMRGTLDLMILRTLLPGPSHGHAIAKHIQRTTEDLLQVETGSLYPALYRLEADGCIAASWETSDKGKRARFYRITPKGPKAARQRAFEVGRVRPRHGGAAEADRRGGAMSALLRRSMVVAAAGARKPSCARSCSSTSQQEARERRAAGTEADDARWAAQRDLGNEARVREDVRAVWTWRPLDELAQDVRYALRTMATHRAVSIFAALSLALGIGANTAIYSFMEAVLLRTLPVPDPDSLVVMTWRAKPFTFSKADEFVLRSISGRTYRTSDGSVEARIFPYPAFERLREASAPFLSSIFTVFRGGRMNVLIDGQAELTDAQYVSGDFFPRPRDSAGCRQAVRRRRRSAERRAGRGRQRRVCGNDDSAQSRTPSANRFASTTRRSRSSA